MDIVILGHGNVGSALADHLLALGEDVTIGIPNKRSSGRYSQRNSRLATTMPTRTVAPRLTS